MKKLECFGVQEMSTKEIEHIDGGFWDKLAATVITLSAGAWTVGEKFGRTAAHYF